MGLLAAGLVFLVLFLLFRSGISWIRIPKGGPAGAAAALFSLGIGEMITFLLVGEETLASGFAVVYLLAGTLLSAYIWKSGCMSRKVAVATVLMSGLFGFVILAPLMPIEFVGVVTAAAGGSPLVTPGLVGVLVGVALALAVGRTFCGHVCPVGGIQELAHALPVRKYVVRKPRVLEAVRAGVFVASVGAALSLVNLMAFTGVYDFFSLTVSVGAAVFVGLLALSVVVYRPVCRALCPFGLLFSIPSHLARYRLRRTGACVDCGRCERACPAGVAARGASKRECYLCGRCVDACRVPGAIGYGP